jgi:hypothetical protein
MSEAKPTQIPMRAAELVDAARLGTYVLSSSHEPNAKTLTVLFFRLLGEVWRLRAKVRYLQRHEQASQPPGPEQPPLPSRAISVHNLKELAAALQELLADGMTVRNLEHAHHLGCSHGGYVLRVRTRDEASDFRIRVEPWYPPCCYEGCDADAVPGLELCAYHVFDTAPEDTWEPLYTLLGNRANEARGTDSFLANLKSSTTRVLFEAAAAALTSAFSSSR